MPNTSTKDALCVVCGHPACHRMRLMIDSTPMRVWSLCPVHAQVVARRDYAIQLEPNWGGKWLYGNDSDKEDDRRDG